MLINMHTANGGHRSVCTRTPTVKLPPPNIHDQPLVGSCDHGGIRKRGVDGKKKGGGGARQVNFHHGSGPGYIRDCPFRRCGCL